MLSPWMMLLMVFVAVRRKLLLPEAGWLGAVLQSQNSVAYG
jgi:hypothetical protein